MSKSHELVGSAGAEASTEEEDNHEVIDVR